MQKYEASLHELRLELVKPATLAERIAAAVGTALQCEGARQTPSPRKRARDPSSVDASCTFVLPEQKRYRSIVAMRVQHARDHHVGVTTYLAARRRQEESDQDAQRRRWRSRVADEAGMQRCLRGEDHALTDEDRCAICLDSVHRTELLLEMLPCGHVFHRGCIRQWSAYRCCCPIDRLPFE